MTRSSRTTNWCLVGLLALITAALTVAAILLVTNGGTP